MDIRALYKVSAIEHTILQQIKSKAHPNPTRIVISLISR